MSKKEVWKIDENGGRWGNDGIVGIVSNKLDWVVAENLLRETAVIICDLFNKQKKSLVCDSCRDIIPDNNTRHCHKCYVSQLTDLKIGKMWAKNITENNNKEEKK